jgi:isocitrate dehydrogenase
VGTGFRSLNVALRQQLDLYANVRLTYHLAELPSPVTQPETMDMVTFRENTEDVYAGIEWEAGTETVQRVRSLANSHRSTCLPRRLIGMKSDCFGENVGHPLVTVLMNVM